MKTALTNHGILKTLACLFLAFGLCLIHAQNLTAGPPKQATIPGLNSEVAGLLFFQSTKGYPPKNKRQYKAIFDKSKAHYINWELALHHRSPPQAGSFRIEWTILHAPSKSLARLWTTPRLEPGWMDSTHCHGFGWEQPGKWAVGEYKVELFVKGVKIASGEFEVEDLSSKGQLQEKGQDTGPIRKEDIPADLGEL